DWNAERLARLTVGKRQGAGRGGVVAAGGGRAVAGGVVDAHAARAAAVARDRDGRRPGVLVHCVRGGTETQRAGLAGRVGAGQRPREAGAVLVLPGVAARWGHVEVGAAGPGPEVDADVVGRIEIVGQLAERG